MFIYVVMHANIYYLQSDLEFISRFVSPDEKGSQGYCFFTHLVSAYTYLAQQGEYSHDANEENSDGATDDSVRITIDQPYWDIAFQRFERESGKVPFNKVSLYELFESESETIRNITSESLPIFISTTDEGIRQHQDQHLMNFYRIQIIDTSWQDRSNYHHSQ